MIYAMDNLGNTWVVDPWDLPWETRVKLKLTGVAWYFPCDLIAVVYERKTKLNMGFCLP
ncbi:hypothetical protein AHIS2_p005 [Acaryochloris phage A-HIS2]|nr:hypothetical protein AHIS2_p005 [Acaryochloris phage A-HIS2]